MYQQSLDLKFPLTEQLSLNLDYPESEISYGDSITCIKWSSELANSYTTIHFNQIAVANQSWLKTKVANWLGIKYI